MLLFEVAGDSGAMLVLFKFGFDNNLLRQFLLFCIVGNREGPELCDKECCIYKIEPLYTTCKYTASRLSPSITRQGGSEQYTQ